MCKRRTSLFHDPVATFFRRVKMSSGKGRRNNRQSLEPGKQGMTALRGRPTKKQSAKKVLSTRESLESASDQASVETEGENPESQAPVTSAGIPRDNESARATSVYSAVEFSATSSNLPPEDPGGSSSRLAPLCESWGLSGNWGQSAAHSNEAEMSRHAAAKQELAQTRRMPDVFKQDEDGDTALHIAIAQCNEQLAAFLIQAMRSKTVDVYNNLRQTPIHVAVITHQEGIVRQLIEGGADVNLVDRNGQTPLHLACREADMQCVRAICESPTISCRRPQVDLRNFKGFTPLHLATFSGNQELIGLILDSGANINVKDSSSGRTALHHAVELGKNPVVEFLLSRGADVNASTYSRNTCLHTATGRCMDDIVQLLLRYGANASITNLEGDAPKVPRKNAQARRQAQDGPEKSKKKRKR